MTKIHVHNYF